MSLWFCVLGSGSGGNCTVLTFGPSDAGAQHGHAGSRHVLIDAGLSPRATSLRLGSLGLTLDDISAIVLTHLDTDHFNPGWLKVLDRGRITLHLHRRHRAAAWRAGLSARYTQLFDAGIELEIGARFESLLLAHDDLGSVGYRIEHAGVRLGFATDLGNVPPSLLERFEGVHALAIESNYDRRMQLASARPAFLKRRIMGGAGHLSNEQALEAVRWIDQCSALSHVALLHLSRQCNCPKLLRELYAAQLPHLLDRLTITSQDQPTPVLHVKAGVVDPARRRAVAPKRQAVPVPEIRQLTLFPQPAISRPRSAG